MLKKFADSAREFKKTTSIAMMALLVALHVVLIYLSIPVTPTLRISVAFLGECLAGAFFGPIGGMVVGVLGDIVGYVVKPTGPFFIGWTINAGLGGLIYGIFLYKRFPKNYGSREADVTAATGDKSIIKLSLSSIVGILLAITGAVLTILLPFIDKIEKEGEAAGSDPYAFQRWLFVAIFIAIAIISIGNSITAQRINAIVGVVAASVNLLSWYSDRKQTVIGAGFIVAVCICYACGIYAIVNCIRRDHIDPYIIYVILAVASLSVFVNMLLGTYWCHLMYGKAFMVYFVSRAIKNIIQMPVNVIIIYNVVGLLKKNRVV